MWSYGPPALGPSPHIWCLSVCVSNFALEYRSGATSPPVSDARDLRWTCALRYCELARRARTADKNGAIARPTASRGRPMKPSNTEFEIYFLLQRGFDSRLMAARAPPHTANDA